MEYLPKQLATYFHRYAKTSIFKIFPCLFFSLILISIISSISEMLATFVFPVLFGLLCIAIAGLSSAKHYERKKFYTTDPLLVKVTATEAFSRLAGMYAHLSHMFFIIFIHLFIFAGIFIGLSPLIVWVYGS